MNRAVVNIAKTLSQIQISQGFNGLLSTDRNCGILNKSQACTSHIANHTCDVSFYDVGQLPFATHCVTCTKKTSTSTVTGNFFNKNSNDGLVWLMDGLALPFMDNYSIKLPTASNITSKVYTFPTAQKVEFYVPSVSWRQLVEINDFNVNDKVAVEDPELVINTPMYADIRVLTIRRHKMNKHKRRKRCKRDQFQLMKYHREQKAKSEYLFQKRMKNKMAELKSFSAEAYVRDVIERAKRDWRTELVPSGRKNLPHWSTLMSLEELYGLEPDDYIDKSYGIPNDEDKARLQELKTKYYNEFLGKKLASSTDVDEKGKK
uniref:DUF1713 domain-containing protein n=1 Tax=Syphacia muris TaxID=451379 RepID=A0A0N5ATQ2_9BILA